jgi:hypothetical protein
LTLLVTLSLHPFIKQEEEEEEEEDEEDMEDNE